MDESVLIIEVPRLSPQASAEICEFLYAVVLAFEAHYLEQIRQHYQLDEFDDEVPF